MGRERNKRNSSRVPGGFVALPWDVLDSAAYASLSHSARTLLLEFARQYVRNNNGQLLASSRHLVEKRRVFNSADTITRAKRELLAVGLIHETVMGYRPNRASWYAVTWFDLDPHRDYDAGTAEDFRRGKYRDWVAPKNARLKPIVGLEAPAIAPTIGVEPPSPAPTIGAMPRAVEHASTPTIGNHLEKPSAGNGNVGRPSSVLPAESERRPIITLAAIREKRAKASSQLTSSGPRQQASAPG